MASRILNADQLQRGDVVKSYPEYDGAWREMTVERTERRDGILWVTLFRPYVRPLWTPLGEDRCTPTIGIEHFTVPCHSWHQFVLVVRTDNLTGEPS